MAVVEHNVLGLKMGKIPMVKILMPYMTGILLGRYFVTDFLDPIPIWLVLLTIVAGIVFFNFYGRGLEWVIRLQSALILVFGLILGYWSVIKGDPSKQMDYFRWADAGQYTGRIMDEPIVKEKTVRFPLQVQSSQVNDSSYHACGTILVTVAKDSAALALRYGDVIAIKNTVKDVAPPYNPHEFDYKAFLQNKDIWYQCYLSSEQYRLLSRDRGNPLIAISLCIRKQLIGKLDTYLHEKRAFQVAIALILGYRSQVDADTLNAFTNTGTIHVLSVSGLHVGLVFGFLTLLLRWMDRFRYGKTIRCVIILLAIWGYVVLTGMAPPILRAGIMISFFLISLAIGRKQFLLNTLAASAFFILLFSPKALFDVGFQLSYMAMLGIILLYPLFRAIYLPGNRYLSWIVEYSYVSIAAQLFTLPFILYYFGQFPNYFLLANLFIALPSTAVMYVGLLLAMSPFDLLSVYLGKVVDFLLVFTLESLEWMAQLPFAVVRGIDWPLSLVLLGMVFIVGFVVALNYRNKLAIFVCMLVMLTMSAVVSYRFVARKTYSGIRLYNVRSGFAMAYIYRGSVQLYSTYDSISHANLRFSVWPDVSRYTEDGKVKFVHLDENSRQNKLIGIGDRHILLLEDKWASDKIGFIDIVVWRKNNRASFDSVRRNLKTKGRIVFDGSNGERYLHDFRFSREEYDAQVYWLKDNFAYVWDRD